VIPCYNEAENLPLLIKELDRELSKIASFKIIVVNDGSSDNSKGVLMDLAARYPIFLLNHKRNMGLSSTLRDGLLEAIIFARSDYLVITMDADNTHKAYYIRQMLEAVRKGAEIVIASRYVEGGLQIGVPNSRILLSRYVNYFLSFLSGLKINDLTSGYRCYRASVLKKVLKKYS
jgi:dolichol-phosphate mannosyltransferase